MKKENLTNWCVYMHTNKQNNKKYIGISSNIKKRWANQGVNYYDQVFGLAIQKYGWDGFVHEILFENLTKEEACLKEKELIEKYNAFNKDYGYNRSKGGDSGSYGAIDVQEQRMRHVFQYDFEGNFIKEYISIASAVRELKPDYIGYNSYNIPTCCNGKRESALGFRWFYEYQGEKIDPILSPLERRIQKKQKTIYQYTLDGTFVQSHPSIEHACNEYNSKTIGFCINGKILTAAGYQWFDEYHGEKIPAVESNAERSKKSKFKPVYKYDLHGNYIESYESISTAAKAVGLKSSSHIGNCCRGYVKSVKGFIWRFTKEDKLELNAVEKTA